MEFAAPSSPSGGSGLRISDIEGHLVVIEPTEYIASMTTSYGDKDAIRVTVHDITTQETHGDVLFFGAIIGELKPQVGKRVLGVIGKGVAKNGQAPPWTVTDASTNADAVAAATAYLTGQVAATITAPATPAPAATTNALDAALGNLAAAGLTK
jgi:hypothetical protein